MSSDHTEKHPTTPPNSHTSYQSIIHQGRNKHLGNHPIYLTPSIHIAQHPNSHTPSPL